MDIRKKSNHKKAVIVLFVAVIGMLLFFPFRQNFWGGLWSSIFIAGVVGGLADWFAVAAIFYKPLGIPFRTAIIPRNRKKILNAVAKMVGEDLLAVENVKSHLDKYSVVKFLLYYFSAENCKKIFIITVVKVFKNAIDVIEPRLIMNYLLSVTFKTIKNLEMNLTIGKILEWSVEKKYLRNLLAVVAKELNGITEKKWFVELLVFFIKEIKKSYEQELENRRLLTFLMEEFGGFSLTSTVEMIKKRLESILSDLQQIETNSTIIIAIEAKIRMLAEKIKNDKVVAKQTNEYIYSWLKVNEKWLNDLVLPKIYLYVEKLKYIEQDDKIYRILSKKIDIILYYISKNINLQNQIDFYFNKIILTLIVKYHKKIGQIVYKRLDNFTDKMLVDFIEAKVGNDLQMIRINGTVVGGLVGAVTYLLSYLVL